MRKLTLGSAIGIAAVALAGCGGNGGASASLVLYSGEHPQLTTALVQAFTRQTHIKVSVRSGDGIVLADQILQEGSSSPGDVFMTENSPELMNLEGHHLLAKLPATTLAQIPAREESPAGDWIGIALRVSSLAYDPARVSAASQLPRSVLELGQPMWKGKIAVAPTDSDFPPVVGAIVATYGKAAAARWLHGLKQNAQIYQDEEAVLATVNRGDVAAGLVNQYYWFRLGLELGRSGVHSKLYYFPNHDPGSIENIAGAAVLASSTHRADAQRLVQFISSPAGQRILAASYDFEYPARPGIAQNSALPPLSSISLATLSPASLGTDQTAVQLIEQAGLA
jgi:iron(III) transport system substrate-binding protein